MLRFEVEKIERERVFVRLSRQGMDDAVLIFEEGEYVDLQTEIKQHGYTCDLIGPRDSRYHPKENE